MKKIYVLWCVLIILFLGILIQKNIPKKSGFIKAVSPLSHALFSKQTDISKKQKTFLFVPYWTIGANDIPSTYDGFIYFGISPTTTGIDMVGEGYQKIQPFITHSDAKKEKLLAVQMVNNGINEQVLHDSTLQNKLIDQTLEIVKTDHFDGVVLDFEFSALPFPAVTDQITKFITNFAHTTHTENKKFFITMYGDVFYRIRPYNVSEVGKQADGLFIMAYDFHKANGDPGGNFPLHKDTNDDYDFTSMITDFLKQVPASKMNVIFGLFGYDWKVNDKGQSISPATALSFLQIQQTIIASCSSLHCQMSRDPYADEVEVQYVDNEQTKHIVWFEDMESISKKSELLQNKGIGNTSFWAYTYF